MLQKWEGVENTTALLKGLLKEERGKLFHFIIVHEYSSIINYNKINDVQYNTYMYVYKTFYSFNIIYNLFIKKMK